MLYIYDKLDKDISMAKDAGLQVSMLNTGIKLNRNNTNFLKRLLIGLKKMWIEK